MDNPTNNSGPVGTPQQQIVERLKSANNILVTVSNNPSVDQLAAAIGLTILLNKMKKHATAVFSGQVPSTIEFLKPEDTIEKNTDSLRDFIIALDKSKADKLRYKVEENIVKIFITPYRTSINENDLEFSQGDFNVDVVLALGVHEQKDLDQAITAHGRILHDAVVISVNLSNASELGAINWTDPTASSLSELAVEITDSLGRDLVDAQIATALLTGIVAETDRFSNEKTSPNTMKLSAELMTAGANQQLVASELQATTLNENTAADVPQDQPPPPAKTRDDGTLEITHVPTEDEQLPPPSDDTNDNQPPQSQGGISDVKQTALDADSTTKAGNTEPPQGRGIMTEAPSLGGVLTANTVPEDADESSDVLGLSAEGTGMPLLGHDKPADQASTKAKSIEPPAEPDLPLPTPVGVSESPTVGETPSEPIGNTSGLGDFQPLESEPPAAPNSPTAPVPPAAEPPAAPPSPAPSTQIHIDADGNLQLPGIPPVTATPVDDTTNSHDEPDTLSDLEQSVHSPHLGSQPDVDSARNAVMDAINNVPPAASSLPPKQDLGATGYLNVQDLPTSADAPAPPGTANEPAPASTSPADQPLDMPLPPGLSIPPANPIPPTSVANDPSAPPPVPPPMTELPPFMNPKQ